MNLERAKFKINDWFSHHPQFIGVDIGEESGIPIAWVRLSESLPEPLTIPKEIDGVRILVTQLLW